MEYTLFQDFAHKILHRPATQGLPSQAAHQNLATGP